MRFNFSYASPSAFESKKDRALLGLSTESSRRVRFRGKLKSDSVFLVRTVLRALGEVIWSSDNWSSGSYDVLDPIVSIHEDKLFFEAFSQDQSVQATLSLDREMFETDGKVICGTSNFDFTSWLWAALGEMRTSRSTWFHLEDEGLELTTVGGGGRFEKKVDIPDAWVRGFLEVQSAATLPGTRLKVKPVDLLSIVRFLRYTKAKTSPRAIRYEFEPNEPARVLLEPWEKCFELRDCLHNYQESKMTRLWGRQRLRLLEPVLPFTESVDIYLKGRGLPSFYYLNLPGITFSLALTGWPGHRWSEHDGFRLLAASVPVTEEKLAEGLAILEEKTVLGDREYDESVLTELCRRGRAFYDLPNLSYRHRELFAKPIEVEKIFPPSPILENARQHRNEGAVEVRECQPRETRKVKKVHSPDGKELREIIYRDWHYTGSVADHKEVEVVLNASEKIIFGSCTCKQFQEQLLTKGPCEHMLALRLVGDQQRTDLPTSEEVKEGP